VSAANLENLLARLYADAPFRRAFLSDPAGIARSHGLAEPEVEALCNIDRGGLELAARSFAHKRAAHGGAGRRRSWLARLFPRLQPR
jgi:hypothetical protein